MKTLKTFSKPFIFSWMLFINSNTIAQQPRSSSGQGGEYFASGDYKIFYTLFPSNFIPAEIADRYGIKRSAYENLLNVMVNKKGEFGGQKVKLIGHQKNLMQQLKTLKFKEIEEKNTVYYLAPVRISGQETLHFVLNVQTEGKTKPIAIEFSKKVYSEN